MDALERAAAVIEQSPLVALACHVTPDGDALGSMLAMHLLCRSQSKASVASFPEPFVVAPHYTYLPGLDLVTKPADFPEAPPVMVTFDCGSLDRLNELAEPAREAGELIVVDHHATNESYGSINLLDADAAASAVMVYRLAKRLGWPIKRDVAICLYTGIVTDTGRFQYSNTTAKALRLAAELVEAGADVHHVFQQVYESVEFQKLKLLARALMRAEIYEGGRVVVSHLVREDFTDLGAPDPYSEGIIDYLRAVEGAEMAALIREPPRLSGPERRVSLRASVDELDVSRIARHFGGGGHRQAAGFTTNLPVEDLIERLRVEIASQLR